MKRFPLLILLLALALLAGCGQASTAGFSEGDLYLNVDGNTYKCRDDIETVLAGLGGGYDYAEGKSCNYDGLDKTYTFPEATFYTNPLAEGDLLNEIYTEDASVTTSKGLAVGAQRADVLAAYGEPAQQDSYLLLYRASDEIGAPALCFELDGEAVTAIYLTLEQV